MCDNIRLQQSSRVGGSGQLCHRKVLLVSLVALCRMTGLSAISNQSLTDIRKVLGAMVGVD